jgi:hypothetical protein
MPTVGQLNDPELTRADQIMLRLLLRELNALRKM